MYLERHGFIDKRTRFYGASFGAFFAASCALTTGWARAPRRVARGPRDDGRGRVRRRRAVHDDYVGTWGVYGELFEHLADAHLPEDTWRRRAGCTSRSRASGCRAPAAACARLISEFRDKRDLVDALTASQYVPGLTCGALVSRRVPLRRRPAR